MKRVLLIQNTGSRHGQVDLSEALWHLKSSGLEALVHKTSNPREGSEVLEKEATNCDAVLIGGGDGTFFHLAESLVESNLPVGILPLGTANNLAQNLHIPFDPAEAVVTFLQKKTLTIPLGRVNGKLFFNTAHIGKGAALFLKLQENKKKTWGQLIFLPMLVQMLFSSIPKMYHITCDQEENKIRAVQFTVVNGSYISGHLRIAPEENIANNKLDLYVMKKINLYLILRHLPSLQRGKHPRIDQGLFTSCRTVTVSCNSKTLVVADGEPATKTPASFELLDHALTVHVSHQFAYQTQGHI